MIPHLFYSSEAVETSLPNVTEIAPPTVLVGSATVHSSQPGIDAVVTETAPGSW